MSGTKPCQEVQGAGGTGETTEGPDGATFGGKQGRSLQEPAQGLGQDYN